MSRSIAKIVVVALVAASITPLTDSATIAAQTVATAARTTLQPKVSCSSLIGMIIPASKIALPTKGATVTSATAVPASGPDVASADALPEYCDVTGAIAPVDPAALPINFKVNVPTRWNQKAWQVGGNGMNGFIPLLAALPRDFAGSPFGPAMAPDRPFLLAQGYATFGSDSGHGGAQAPGPAPAGGAGRGDGAARAGGDGGRGRGGAAANPNAWMANDEVFRNFGHEQIKKTHDAAFEVLRALYGVVPNVMYFGGQSQGGRDALMALAHYGDDYDGVSASVGLVYFTGILLSPAWRLGKQLEAGAWSNPAKVRVLEAEVVRQCDGLDNLADGVIHDYYTCHRLFDPTQTPNPLAHIRCSGGADTGDTCLSDKQIETINAFHAPVPFGFPLANGETDWPGEPVGREAQGGWLMGPTPPVAAVANGPQGVLQARYGDQERFDFSKHLFSGAREEIQALSKILDVPTDWSKFLNHGGKLILHSAANDYLVNPRGTIRLYEEVIKKNGDTKIRDAVRYYVTPQAPHSSEGFSLTTGKPAPRHTDLLTALEQWVENKKVPANAVQETLRDLKPPYTVRSSRPLCTYPMHARYNGTGDLDRMESYTCAMPQTRSTGTR